MIDRPARLLLSLSLTWAVGLPAAGSSSTPEAAEPLSELERGRAIYLHGKTPQSGTSQSPPILAVLGGQTHELPAEYLPCASCHGEDGRGRPEGGVSPSDLTWDALTRPYEVDAASGRSHPPYDRRLFIRAVTMGIDPAGNELGIAMPRYRLSRIDAEALATFVESLGQDGEPGVLDDRLRLGTLLPSQGPRASAGRAVEAVLRARFDEAASAGGIYGRTLDLVVVSADDGDAQRALDELFGHELLAVVAPFSTGVDDELVRRAAAEGVPVVGPLSLAPSRPGPRPAPVFYLLSGIEQQLRVLWDFAAGRHFAGRQFAGHQSGEPRAMRAAALVPADPPPGVEPEAWLAVLGEQAQHWGLEAPAVVRYGRGDLGPELLDDSWTDLFFLGPGDDGRNLLAGLESAAEPVPRLHVPGPLAGSLMHSAGDVLHLAFPALPSDAESGARRDWQRFAAEYDLPTDHVASQRLAAVAAELLLDALRGAGRGVTRRAVVQQLESLYRHETDWTPPLTYGANRRIGALGGYVVTLDAEGGFVPISGWIEPRS